MDFGKLRKKITGWQDKRWVHRPFFSPFILSILPSCYFFFLCCFGISLFADEEEELVDKVSYPWFTGPLLTPSAGVTPLGDVNFQTYLNLLTNKGVYNKAWKAESIPNFYTLQSRNILKAGISHFAEVILIPEFVFQETKGQRFIGIGDTRAGLGIQLLRGRIKGSMPFIKLGLLTTIPTGHYQHLNAQKKGTDAMGLGCWFPGPALYISKTWHVKGVHYFHLRSFFDYRFGVPVRVRGLNAYGGDSSTRGFAYPGNEFHWSAAFEYSLTTNWAFACDAVYSHTNKNRFSGKTTAPMTFPSQDVYSIAPAIEYNWGQDLGVIGGLWFSAAGRNAPQFINGMLSLNMHFGGRR